MADTTFLIYKSINCDVVISQYRLQERSLPYLNPKSFMIPLIFSIVLYFTVLQILAESVFHNQFSRIFCLMSSTVNLKFVGKRGVKEKPVLWVAACSNCVVKKNIERY